MPWPDQNFTSRVMKHTLLILLVCAPYLLMAQKKTKTADAPVSANQNLKPQRKASNVILIVAEGMGLSQLTAGLYTNDNRLQAERFTNMGFLKAHSTVDLSGDNGSAATAFACGVKTYPGAIGVGRDSQVVKNILEEATEKGLSTGIVTTGAITEATAAGFYAHLKQIRSEEEVAEQLLGKNIDLLIGGGENYFTQRKDQRNLLKGFEDKGYFVSDFAKSGLSGLEIDFSKKFLWFSSLEQPLSRAQGREYLAPATKFGTTFLQKHSDKGFFLLVNATQIETGGANNDNALITSEMLDMDQAVGLALNFAKENNETLVILAGNHETGGYALNPGSEFGKMNPAFTTKGNTGQLVPIMAFGPAAELFSGIIDNTEVYGKLRRALGWE
jgi:alkaline phosphatase